MKQPSMHPQRGQHRKDGQDHISATRRQLLGSALGIGLVSTLPGLSVHSAHAQSRPSHPPTRIRFQLDWRFEGQSALFVTAAAKGYFKDENLDVQIDSGNGSGSVVSRVVSGVYQMGFADMATLMEFHGNNPDAPNKPVGIMMLYNNTPGTVFALKKSGIKTPKDLEGKKLGAPSFDASRQTFPVFAQANNVDESKVEWLSMEPTLRETMLVRGDLDAITGYYFTSLLGLRARGVSLDDIITLRYPQYGVKLYSNTVVTSPGFAEQNPQAVRGFLRALTRAVRDVLADPEGHIRYVKERDGVIDEATEIQRLKLCMEGCINTEDARREGFGDIDAQRLAVMARQISQVYATRTQVSAGQVFDRRYLPTAAERSGVLKL